MLCTFFLSPLYFHHFYLTLTTSPNIHVAKSDRRIRVSPFPSLTLRVASSESGSFCDSYFFLLLSSAQSFSSHSAVCVCPQKRRREISFCIMLDFVTNAECTRVLLLTLSPQLCLAPLLLPSCEFMGSGATWLLFILHSLSHKRGEGKACVCEGVRVRVEGAGSVLDRD